MSYKRKTVSYFDKHATSTKLTGRLFNIKMRIVKEHIGKKDYVLDAGCGNGEVAVPLSAHCHHVYAVDLSSGVLKQLRSRLKGRIKNCTTIKADLENIPLKSRSVDAVISFATLYYIKDLPAVLKEFKRVLKPGAVMILELFNSKSFESYYSKRNFDVPQFHTTFTQYEHMLRRQGLKIEKVHRLQLIPNVLVPKWMDRALGLRIGSRTIDELISSLPLLRLYATKFIFVVRVA